MIFVLMHKTDKKKLYLLVLIKKMKKINMRIWVYQYKLLIGKL